MKLKTSSYNGLKDFHQHRLTLKEILLVIAMHHFSGLFFAVSSLETCATVYCKHLGNLCLDP